MENRASSSFQHSSRFCPLEFPGDMWGQSCRTPCPSPCSPGFRNHQNLSTSSPIACVSFSAFQPLAVFAQASSGLNSATVTPATSCSSTSCSCSSSAPLPLNSLIPSPFSSSSLSSFFPAHVAQQCSLVACSSSCSTAASAPVSPLIQPRHGRRSEARTRRVKRTGPRPSEASYPGVVRLSSLASLATALQAFSHSSGKGFVAGRDRSEDEHVDPADGIGDGARKTKQLPTQSGSGMGLRFGSSKVASANSSLSSRISCFLQQLPGELDGYRRHKFGQAAATAAKPRRGLDAARDSAPNGNETKDTKEMNEKVTTTEVKQTRKKAAIQTTQHLLAGAIAAMVSRTLVAPLERLKLEYLVRGAQGSVLSTVQKILKNEGPGGFWKGNLVNLLRTAPFKAVNFFCYDSYRNYLLQFGNRKEVTNLERLAAGAAAGVTATILCFPLDTIRTTMVAPGGETLGGLVGCFNHMVRTEGLLSFYKGLLPAVVSMAPSGAVFYGVYDMLKIAYLNSPDGKEMLKARRKRMKEAKERGEEAWVQPELGPVRTLLFGAIAGACAESVTYPFEVIRRAQQMQHAAVKLGMAATVQMLLRKGGVKALYAGLFPSTLQVLPSAAFSYFVYETMKITFKIP